jgi:GntR family transcriptional regulator
MAAKTSAIDFNSHIPYYLQLIELLKNRMIQKVWKPGDQIPGEQDLCTEFGVSRTVVRQALGELENSSLIVRRKGRGTFVAEPKISESLVQKLTGFYQDMVEHGMKPITHVLSQVIEPANLKISGYLEIEPGAQLVKIERLRFIEEEPIQLVTSYIPLLLAPTLPEVDLTNRSLYEFLEKECGIFIAKGRRYIEAVSANEKEAKLLNVERGAPLMLLNSISFLEDGRPVEYYHALHRGDRTRFEVELVRARDAIASHNQGASNLDQLPPAWLSTRRPD